MSLLSFTSLNFVAPVPLTYTIPYSRAMSTMFNDPIISNPSTPSNAPIGRIGFDFIFAMMELVSLQVVLSQASSQWKVVLLNAVLRTHVHITTDVCRVEIFFREAMASYSFCVNLLNVIQIFLQ